MDTLTAAKALGVPLASFANKILRMEPDQGLDRLIPVGMARAWLVLPLFLDGDTLAVAAVDPSDAILLADLAKFTKHPVEPFIAAEDELLLAISRAYR